MPPRMLRPARMPRLPLQTTHQHHNPSFFQSSRAKSTLRPDPKDSGSKKERRWKPIPVALGVAFLGAFQLYRINKREREEVRRLEPDDDDASPAKRRQRIRPSGPWTVQVMSTIPLKALSRWWGWFNSIELPYYLRVPGFKLYGYVFGVNFDEIEEQDLHKFKNLAEFFYRTIRPECRPLDPTRDAILSPADGRVIQFGVIEGGEVEQVKGVTYSVDALLGDTKAQSASSNIAGSKASPQPSGKRTREGDEETIRDDEEFAQVNGISYTLPDLLSGGNSTEKKSWWQRIRSSTTSSSSQDDQSTKSSATSEQEVARDLASSPNAPKPWYAASAPEVPTTLYYCVVYLAPGDYHRFHSPVSWVVESRRHFAGELYSVSPYLQRTLPGLFTLNERVVLLGRWKYGFFSYTPVGATNVGSIIINFDKELRTNSLLTDTRADREAEAAKQRGEVYAGYAEAGYSSASSVLGGHALRKGEEMGGFQLGSTIVLVFEAPKGRRPTFDEGFHDEGRKGGWRWGIEKGMKVKVGERLGWVEEEDEAR
ncbi:related to phosphatidylserine decarboxylase [Ramularia collo-cygni]|uniref:Phosphatidylserine decarboxylase proenzyme 1, mitochondrial n=1 Tax=Ramularia collo-cygni TaxID=112498 RepID=A0A2D3UQB6_9PEZI|nr:related to phosphatidylserine decarboxylase [Ramularia collo-cygni]CZT19022.1 related to phosphatidylserine decarboxylase [Ramularia collo-cygni]